MSRHNRSEQEVAADETIVAGTQEIPAAPVTQAPKARAPRGSLPPKVWTKPAAAGAVSKILDSLTPEDRAAVLAFVQ